MPICLEIKNATKKFAGLTANENISFDVEKGSIVGIVGPNGAGKTTLFNSITGVHNLTSGQIIYNETDITKKSAHEVCMLGIGRTFQIPQSLDNMTVLENVIIGALGRHNDIKCATEKAKEALDFCSLSSFSAMFAGKLNVAQKKRLEIARSLATEPDLLLLDETMAGLTPTERLGAVELIYKLNETGITILTIEHVMDVVMKVSDKVVVLNAGKLLMEGLPEEVINNEDVIHAYLGGRK